MPPKSHSLNPVFTAWLEEMRDELDSDSNYWKVYNRAAKSMRSHPRRLEDPRECVEVKYIGPKIQKLLIERHEARVKEAESSNEDPIPKATGTIRKTHGPAGQCNLPLTSPGLDSEAEVLATKSLRPKKAESSQRTSKTPKSTKKTPARPRISEAILAPAAISDPEPESDDQLKSPLKIPNAREFAPFEPLIFKAGTYIIQLVLDEREVKSTRNRDYMLQQLKKRGVDAVKRSLEVGDVCWIAQLNDGTQECVLDYIVERKRLDDLKGSILDGRFHEQKFRLKHTGISHLYYLVEDYNTERIARHWGDQINTALSSTQVIDRFFLKETTSVDDSLDYLSNLHKTISNIYADKDLYIIPPQLVKRYSFLALKEHLSKLDPERTFHTTYASYQELNRKNGFYTVQDCMARMLQCIRGLSEEKIASLLEYYPTPRSLYEAFLDAEKHNQELGRVGMGKEKGKSKVTPTGPEIILSELGGKGRRKIGPALSKHIYELFMALEY